MPTHVFQETNRTRERFERGDCRILVLFTRNGHQKLQKVHFDFDFFFIFLEISLNDPSVAHLETSSSY